MSSPVWSVGVEGRGGVTVGGVGDVAGSSPGAPVHGVGVGAVVRHASIHLAGAGGVALALVAGGGLGPATGAGA